MKVVFWGCRGSTPCPGANTVRYGGNTSCIEIRNSTNDILILDAGSGIRELGMSLLREMPIKASLLICHTHWDHIHGFPFFAPAFIPKNNIQILGPAKMVSNKSIGDVLAEQMNYAYFPVRTAELLGKISYIDQMAGRADVEGFDVNCFPSNHPILSIGSRIEADRKVVVFTGDHEPYRDTIYPSDDMSDEAVSAREFAAQQNTMLEETARGADLLICDCQYTDKEYETKIGWGHSSVGHCIDRAVKAGVKKLALTHHDPLKTDNDLDVLEAEAKKRMEKASGKSIEVFYAREQMIVEL
ncbi:MBL fold metallo-hydrolase [bacterium]|nr:MBL fold metallo-hydrolase [bacterium]